jgi:DNA-binding NarL/FixJ family response regulator
MERGVRVFLLTASRLVQDALTRVITRRTNIRVVGAGVCSPHILDSLKATAHDVLLVDWASAGEAAFDTLHVIGQDLGEHKSVLLGMKGDRESFLKAIKAGAKAILLEDASAADVTAAIRAVVAGQAVCPPSLSGYLFDLVGRQSQNLPNARLRVRLGLTRREQELLPLIARGLSNKEIAVHFCLSEQTVKNHIHRMLRKTGANDRLEVIEACDEETRDWHLLN